MRLVKKFQTPDGPINNEQQSDEKQQDPKYYDRWDDEWIDKFSYKKYNTNNVHQSIGEDSRNTWYKPASEIAADANYLRTYYQSPATQEAIQAIINPYKKLDTTTFGGSIWNGPAANKIHGNYNPKFIAMKAIQGIVNTPVYVGSANVPTEETRLKNRSEYVERRNATTKQTGAGHQTGGYTLQSPNTTGSFSKIVLFPQGQIYGTDVLHEFNHAASAGIGAPVNNALNGRVQQTLKDYDVHFPTSYLENPEELRNRRIEFIKDNRLEPDKRDYTEEDVEKLKKKEKKGRILGHDFLSMPTGAVVDALNNWVCTKKENNANVATV